LAFPDEGRIESRKPLLTSGWAALGLMPSLLRFGFVGLAGLATDVIVFSILHGADMSAFLARLVSIACATLVTWRLNRHFTFAKTEREESGEAARYAAVAIAAQSINFLVFASIIHLVPGFAPHYALFIGAASAALFSFEGHRFFSFAPKTSTKGG
jgi:putative flippase GtrA